MAIHQYYFSKLHIADTLGDLPPVAEIGMIYEVLSPLSLYAYTAGGWVALASPSGSPTSPTPASEAGQGVVELATQGEVEAGTAGILAATAARLKAELDRRGAIAATETALGPVELATSAETQAGTDATRAVHPAGLKAALTPEAWIAPTLLNGWVNYGAPYDNAGYRKEPAGLVRLRGVIKNGTIANGTVLFNLPVGYRPSAQRSIPSYQGGADDAIRLEVATNGDVSATGLANNFNLLLDGVVFVR
jgi:hypothetical protein